MTVVQRVYLTTSRCHVAVHIDGPDDGPVVVLAHSILSSAGLWAEQAALLQGSGYRVLRPDIRGHGQSDAPAPPWSMDDLALDVVEMLDGLGIAAAHYVGVSLGGMCGFGLGVRHSDRLLSLCLCDCRSDAPAAFAQPWDERIAIAQAHGCAPLAVPTVERWLGESFVSSHPDAARRLQASAASTSTPGLVGCALAIQQLDYRAGVASISVPTTLIVGENDGGLPAAMKDLCHEIPHAVLQVITDSGHLPNIDQPAQFNAALTAHLRRAIEQTA